MKPPRLMFNVITVIDHVATGALMRQYREACGLSLREVARRLRLSAAFVSDLERGRRSWTQQRLNQVCAAINQV